MLSLATQQNRRHVGFMPTDEGDERQARLYGRALAALRTRNRMTQAEAAARYAALAGLEDFSPQAWGLYEAGKRVAIFRPDTQRFMLSAIDASILDFNSEVARQRNPRLKDTPGIAEAARPFSLAHAAPARHETRIHLGDDDMVLSYPARLDPKAMRHMVDHLELIVRQLREKLEES